jgi:hypothetical protein
MGPYIFFHAAICNVKYAKPMMTNINMETAGPLCPICFAPVTDECEPKDSEIECETKGRLKLFHLWRCQPS